MTRSYTADEAEHRAQAQAPARRVLLPPAGDGAPNRTMEALQAVVRRYPDRCLALCGDFSVPDINWSRTEYGWATQVLSRPSRRALNFIDTCEVLHAAL